MAAVRNRLTYLLAAIALTAPAAAAGQGPGALRLTLEDAQARAVESSHRLAEARAREAAAQAVVASRAAADLPIVSAAAGYTRTNHVTPFIVPGPTGLPQVLYPDVPDNYRTRLDLQWPIYTGGRSDALERAARAEAAAVAAEVVVARAELQLEVARAFWAVVTAGATASVLEQGVSRAQAHVADARERFNAGLVPPNEIASAEAQVARARMLLIEARNQRDVSLADLSRLAGLEPAAAAIEPAAALDAAAGPVAPSAALLDEARGARGERRAIERRIEAADEQLAATAASRRPVIAVAGGIDYARPNAKIFPRRDVWQESWDVGVNVGWTLWDGGRSAADTAASASLATAARLRLEEFDSILAVEVRQRTLDIDAGRAAVAAADETIRAAAEARRVVTERYRAGVGTQIEVLDAEFALLQSELDRTRALAGVRLAEARLARALGR